MRAYACLIFLASTPLQAAVVPRFMAASVPLAGPAVLASAVPAPAMLPASALTTAPLPSPSASAAPALATPGPARAAASEGPQSRPPAAVPAGTVFVLQDVRSAILGNSRSVAVYLPPGYQASGRRYPVLYFHDGQNAFDPATAYGGRDWGLGRTADSLIAAGLMEPAIIVAPYNNADRIAEYTPVPDSEYGGGRGDLYGRFLTDELKPLIDARLRTRPGPEDTAVMGASLGGLISLHLALDRPDAFSRAGVMSPSLWWADEWMLKRLAGGPAPESRPRLWADAGTLEGGVERIARLEALLAERGWRAGTDLDVRVFEGARHDEASWRERAGLVLAFLFPPAGVPK